MELIRSYIKRYVDTPERFNTVISSYLEENMYLFYGIMNTQENLMNVRQNVIHLLMNKFGDLIPPGFSFDVSCVSKNDCVEVMWGVLDEKGFSIDLHTMLRSF